MVAKKTTSKKAAVKKVSTKKDTIKKGCQCGNPNCNCGENCTCGKDCHCGENCHCSNCHCGCFKKLILIEIITIILTVLITLAISGRHRGYRVDCRGPHCERLRDNNAPCPYARDWDRKGWNKKDERRNDRKDYTKASAKTETTTETK